MTPHELNLHVESFTERMRHDYKEKLTMSYLTAYWGRSKKMPELKKLLGEEAPKKQSDKDMLDKVRALNAAFGGIVEHERSGE